jgi:glycine cleavage system H protein
MTHPREEPPVATPDDRRYTSEHEWAKADGDLVVVGITDHAQDALGDIVFLELPEVGRQLAQNEALGVVESVKAVSDIYSPIGGEVVEVNEALVTSPEIINRDPYEAGWMIKVRPADPAGVDTLMSAADYDAHTAGAAH